MELQHYSREEIEDADFQAVASRNSSAIIVLPEGTSPHTNGATIEFLSRGIPQNEFGLPLYFIRSDMLPSSIYTKGTVTQDDVDASTEDVYYHEGFPTLSDGRIFWGQLPHEPHTNYQLFKAWLDLGEIEGIRLQEDLARAQHVELSTVSNAYKEFYWSARARAYDLFIVAAEQKKREHRIRRAENKHFQESDSLLSTLLDKFADPEWIDSLSAKEAIDVFETLVKIQRQSLGLNQNTGSPTNSKMAPGSSAEVIFRQIAQQTAQEGTGDTINQLQELLGNRDSAMLAQELILRVNRQG